MARPDQDRQQISVAIKIVQYVVYFYIYGKENYMDRPMTPHFSNIILIGMAGAGKSTVGRILAGQCARIFVDTDALIEKRCGCSLQQHLETVGIDAFRRLEEQVLLGIEQKELVVATGGSAIYSERGMAHLKSTGPLVLLEASLATVMARIHNQDTRGLINPDGTGLADLYHGRRPLYDRWADWRISVDHDPPAAIAEKILSRLDGHTS
jgi:shikimate kinase